MQMIKILGVMAVMLFAQQAFAPHYSPPAPGKTQALAPNDLLLQAAGLGNLQNVQVALQKGANVNSTDNSGMTALMMAAKYGFLNVVNELLQSKYRTNINAKDNSGMSALGYAQRSKNAPIVQALKNAHAQ